MTTVNNSRLAKNTLLLYVRMLLLMLVSLYTSRIVLNALGINDYGIYNVVGGFVAMFSVISSSISAGIQRFITFELGKTSDSQLKEVFSTSIFVQFIIFGIVVLLAESIGLWFINYKLNIGNESRIAANWVYQCSLLTFLFNLLSIPYNAAIIAHEKMSAFAYISIIEVVLKFAVALLITCFGSQRLIIYAICLAFTSIIIRCLYTIYCRKHFEECRESAKYHSKIFREILSFSGWNFFGSTVGILRDQGVNILLNLFFGTTINAARGIANQVSGAVTSFASNFIVAVNPQITKSYAAGEKDIAFHTALRASKFSYYIILLICVPIILNTPFILKIWLKIVPQYAAIFTRLTFIMMLVDVISPPLTTIMLAYGKLRNFQIIGIIGLLNLPASYLALKLGAEPQVTYWISIGLCAICCLCRVVLLNRMVGLSISQFLSQVVLRISIVTIIIAYPCYLINGLFSQTLSGLCFSTVLQILFISVIILYIGCTIPEQTALMRKGKEFIFSKILHKQ